MTRPLCAYAPDPEPPLARQVLGWALSRPAQLAFFIALTVGAFWSFTQ